MTINTDPQQFQVVLTELVTANARLTNALATLLEADASPAEKAPKKRTTRAKKAEEPKEPPAEEEEKTEIAEAEPKTEKKPEPKKEPATKKESKLVLLDVQKPLLQYAKAHGRTEAQKLVAEFTPNGEDHLKMVPEDKWADLKAKAEKGLEDA